MRANFTGVIKKPIDSRGLYDTIRHLGNINVIDTGNETFIAYDGDLSTITNLIWYLVQAGPVECTIRKEVAHDGQETEGKETT